MNELATLFSIATGSPEPIYRQLVGQVHRRVAAGQWAAGTEMPSVRELALALALNPMTVSKAFSILESEGVLVRRRGLSMVVADTAPRSTTGDVASTLLQPTLMRAVAEAKQAGLSQAQALALFETVWHQHNMEMDDDRK
jgi:GntR family transcriptional regulator